MGMKTDTQKHRQQYGSCQKEAGWGVVKGKLGEIYGDGKWFDFGWWVHNVMYAWKYIILLSNVIPINLN